MSLIRNAAFNFMGAAVPALLAIGTIPYIVSTLGTADYGLLALITSIVGYFALLDINITASSTKYVSEFNASGDKERLNETVSFGLVIYGAIGTLGLIGLFFSADFLAKEVFSVPAERHFEAALALRVASLGFLFGQIQAYLHSLPGALMRFDISARIEAVFGTIVPLATIGLLYAGYGLVGLVWLRVGMSLLQGALTWQVLRRLLPTLRWATPTKDIRIMMLSFSAYSFLSRLAALTYANADKLVIGARVGVTALTYFVVPATLANRVMSLVFRLSSVMFPHASALAAQGRMEELERDYLFASRYLFFINGAIAVVMATMATPILAIWLSPDFAKAGAAVMVMIALAQWVDSTTNLPSLVNDGLGHPKISGLFALTRAGIGLALILAGVWAFGIEGAAGAHLAASVLMSAAFVVFVHGRTVPIQLRAVLRQAYLPSIVVLLPVSFAGVAIAPWAKDGWMQLILSVAFMGLLITAGGWWSVCLPAHRAAILQRTRSVAERLFS